MYSLFIIVFLALSNVQAHMEMSNPAPFRSKYLKVQTQTDYSMTSPLSQSAGLEGLCKGYAGDLASSEVSATIAAGSDLTVDIAGSASHEGGSCEFSVSYDEGKTFAVIHRVVGGCPLSSSYSFTVPKDLPASNKAILSWSWMNRTGNREFYHNCAPVAITGTSKSYTGPSMFIANIFGDGSCVTKEGEDYQFPDVNAVSTEFGGSMSASSPVTVLDGCSVDQSKMVTVTGDGSAGEAPEKVDPPPSPKPTPEASSIEEPAPQSSATSVASPEVKPPAPASSTAQKASAVTSPRIPEADPTPIADAGSCNGGEIKCTSMSSFSMCSNGTWIAMGNTAAGISCIKGDFVESKRMKRHRLNMRRMSH